MILGEFNQREKTKSGQRIFKERKELSDPDVVAIEQQIKKTIKLKNK